MAITEAKRKLSELFGDSPVRERSYALPAHRYQDPAKVIEQAELKTCKGCKFELRVEIEALKRDYWICRDRNERGLRRPYGTRCHRFQEMEGRGQ